MRILFLSDRLSLQGGADQHLLQVISAVVDSGAEVRVAYGRLGPGTGLPRGATAIRIRGLASAVASRSRLAGLNGQLAWCDAVHLQNVMNPVVLERAVATGRAIVTVQDHRFFCPGPGRTLPDGSPCRIPMSGSRCAACLPDEEYRTRLLELTAARQQALQGAALVVLSRYMAQELADLGLEDVRVIPPWVATGEPRSSPGEGFLMGGRLVSHKGVMTAWLAWQTLQDRGCPVPGRPRAPQPLRIAGAGPLEEQLIGATRLGWLPWRELHRIMRASLAMLFPTRWQEPFGILGLEALAQGLPVIVAESGGTGDWSEMGCIRVKPGGTDAMARAMDSLAADPDRALELGEQGRQLVAERFARLRIEPDLLGLYRHINR